MKKNKGISLIVLVITIIVIIILATAILVSVISNNPIIEANKARYESDRDNMQAVFTNTVGKIMAENQGVVNVTAGQINTEVSGVNETTGEVAYTVANATVAANGSGTIIFDKNTNTATTYYTGKKLPIYAAGETKWYVDSDGVISLEVAGVKYGSGEIVSNSEEETLAPGLYAEDGTMTISWSDLISTDYQSFTYLTTPTEEGTTGILYVDENGVLKGAYDCMMLTSYCSDYLNGKLIIDNSVTSIGDEAFKNCTNLTSVVIPEGVTSIGYDAFYGCTNLTSITIPEGVTTIGQYAFQDTSLTSITIPGSVANIPSYFLLDNSSIESVILEDGVETISKEAFHTCCFATITIPKTVTSIGESAFNDNVCLRNINYNGTKEEWNSINFATTEEKEWNRGCLSEITVHCTDGDIVIPANT